MFYLEHGDWEKVALKDAAKFVRRHPKYRADYEKHLKEEIKLLKQQHRQRRHVGPHDDEGVATLVSTPTLAPSINTQKSNLGDKSVSIVKDWTLFLFTASIVCAILATRIDIIYATFWRQTDNEAEGVSENFKKCAKVFYAKELQRFDPKSEPLQYMYLKCICVVRIHYAVKFQLAIYCDTSCCACY